MIDFSPDKILNRVARFLERYRIDYLLIGGMALSVWGRPRTTLDLDFLILIDKSALIQLKGWIRKEKWNIDLAWLKWNPLLKNTQLRIRLGRALVDLLLPRDTHDRLCFKRKKRKKLGRHSYHLIGPEDFILQKLKVGRPRDFEDAVTVLERQRKRLDMRYLKKWAKRLGILGELNYILGL